MHIKRADWISLIESSYALDCNDQEWLDKLFDCALPLVDPGMRSTAWTYRCTPTSFQLGKFSTLASPWVNALCRAGHAIASREYFDLAYRGGVVVGSLSELFPRLTEFAPRIAERRFLGLTRGRLRDAFMAGGQSGTGLGVAFGTYVKNYRKPSALERKRWPQVAAHLGAGLRLRSIARGLSLDSRLDRSRSRLRREVARCAR